MGEKGVGDRGWGWGGDAGWSEGDRGGEGMRDGVRVMGDGVRVMGDGVRVMGDGVRVRRVMKEQSESGGRWRRGWDGDGESRGRVGACEVLTVQHSTRLYHSIIVGLGCNPLYYVSKVLCNRSIVLCNKGILLCNNNTLFCDKKYV